MNWTYDSRPETQVHHPQEKRFGMVTLEQADGTLNVNDDGTFEGAAHRYNQSDQRKTAADL